MIRSMLWATAMLLAGANAWAGPDAPTWQEPGTGMVFVAIPKGCFQMGSAQPVEPPADTMWHEIGYVGKLSDNEKPRHEVCVDAFWLGRYEVTVKAWRAVMGGAADGRGDDAPMAGLSWEQARLFAQRLGERSGQRLRLPTEAEWEYACRAGATAEALPERSQLAQQARYGLGSPTAAEAVADPVGRLAANAFGLHDMLGNVWEWVADSYHVNGYARHSLYNPRVDSASAQHVIRGGSFRTEFAQVRCSRRGHQPAAESLNTIGFRLVRQP